MCKKKLKFRVSSALKNIVGQDLITDEFVAVFELVKNSIDAGANKIDIHFKLGDESPSIWIVDNGKGMSFEDIRDKWMFLGYSAKKEGVEDEAQKVYAGNKGVGRFSCDRLGGRFEIQAKTKESPSVHQVRANWQDFEQSALEEFGSISLTYQDIPLFALPKFVTKPPTGVALNISDLRNPESWTRTKLLRLKSSLGKLINPFGGSSNSRKIILHCIREREEDQQQQEKFGEDAGSRVVNGSVENKILDLLDVKTTKLESSIKEGYLHTTLSDRGLKIYSIREPLSDKFEELRGAKFRGVFYYLNHSAKTTFARRMNLDSVNFGSVFLYRNGYQVFPVGENGNDYWGLERRKAQGYNRYLSGRELMGRIDVSGPETKFKESSSRDKGLIDTPATAALQELLLSLVRRFERYVAQISWKDKLDQEFETPERLSRKEHREAITKLISDLARSKNIEVLNYNKDLVQILQSKAPKTQATLKPLREMAEKHSDSKLLGQLDKAEKELTKLKKEALQNRIEAESAHEAREEAVERALESEKESLLVKSLHARDDSLQLSQHLIPQYSQSILEFADSLYKGFAKSEGEIPQVWLTRLSSIIRLTKMVQKLTKFNLHANYRTKVDSLNEDVVLFVDNYIHNVLESNVLDPKANKTEVVFSAPEGLAFKLKFQPIRLSIVLDNLFFNSTKHGAKMIQIEANIHPTEKKLLIIAISDNGRGINAQIEDQIFKQGFSTTKGSGLGLFHVRHLLKDMGGKISLDREYKKGARFIIELEKP